MSHKKYRNLPGTTAPPNPLTQQGLLAPPVQSAVQAPPGPDISDMVDNAATIIAAGVSDQARSLPAPVLILPGTRGNASYTTRMLWGGDAQNPVRTALNPARDTFTLFIMATLSRFSYGQGNYDPAIITTCFPELTYTHIAGGIAPLNLGFDKWADSQGRKVLVFPAQLSQTGWTATSPYLMVADTKLRAGWSCYKALMDSLNSTYAAVESELSANVVSGAPAVLVGHDQGGVIAQFGAVRANDSRLTPPWTSFPSPVVGVYTFGSPNAFASVSRTNSRDVAELHTRVINTLDPIPDSLKNLTGKTDVFGNPWGYDVVDAMGRPVSPSRTAVPTMLCKWTVKANDATADEQVRDVNRNAKFALQSAYTQVATLIDAHSTKSYSLSLELTLRGSGAFDANLFPLLVAAQRAMDVADASRA